MGCPSPTDNTHIRAGRQALGWGAPRVRGGAGPSPADNTHRAGPQTAGSRAPGIRGGWGSEPRGRQTRGPMARPQARDQRQRTESCCCCCYYCPRQPSSGLPRGSAHPLLWPLQGRSAGSAEDKPEPALGETPATTLDTSGGTTGSLPACARGRGLSCFRSGGGAGPELLPACT